MARHTRRAKGSKVTVRNGQGTGLRPQGVRRAALHPAVHGLLKLRDIGGVLPPYDEGVREIAMEAEQARAYRDLSCG